MPWCMLELEMGLKEIISEGEEKGGDSLQTTGTLTSHFSLYCGVCSVVVQTI